MNILDGIGVSSKLSGNFLF